MTKKIKIEAQPKRQVKDPNRLPTEFILRIIKTKLEYDMMTKLEKYIIEAKPNNDNIVILPKKGTIDFTMEIMEYLEDYNKEHAFPVTFQEKFVKINDVQAKEITFYIHTRKTNRTLSSLTLLPKLIEEDSK